MNNIIKNYLDKVGAIFDAEQFIAEPRELYAPIEYTLRLGGKRIRPTMLLMANALFGGDEQQVRNAALGIETFHNFTLLHDDLMDRSPLRRGQPTVYTKWDENTAILSGDTMFALAWRYFLRQSTPKLQEILQCFNETAIEVCEGQQKDMNFERMGLANVSIDNYMDMIRQKTAVLLAGALKIGALYAGAPADEVERLYAFGIHLGLAFQMQDDLLDGYGDTAVFGKTGQDIRDNKISFLPLTALKNANEERPERTPGPLRRQGQHGRRRKSAPGPGTLPSHEPQKRHRKSHRRRVRNRPQGTRRNPCRRTPKNTSPRTHGNTKWKKKMIFFGGIRKRCIFAH